MTAAAKEFSPRYWTSWLLIGLFRLFTLLPWRLQLGLGRYIGRVARGVARRRREITRHNLGLCFGDMSEAERKRLAADHFASLGIGLIEAANAWWKSPAWLRRHMHIEGLEQLEAALGEGRGALLLTAHYTTLEMGAQMLGISTPTTGVYRHHENPVFDRVMHAGRLAHGGELLERGDLRGLLRALRKGSTVWFAPDQAYIGTHSAEVPFFGAPAPTNTATARIAAASRAPVLPFHVERLSGSGRYRITIEPPLQDFPSGDDRADAARVNAVLEAGIRRNPAQYLWSHDRFKHFRRP
ncbi:MAG: LpxL/LpxP family Kdo(2)-lipid IV(A) lauroyl/palmitoleoyl acyltransferase [Gammaproteobacteria bacterium]|nr:LpxL/LpxP family Kdo(2)-lipid IV(A) lauroyl/palmitoleoyl acyltransferase [Gammaproteobacteria bacterium]